jgi:hypothetical protein
MWIFNWTLSLTSKSSKNAATLSKALPLQSGIDNFHPKAMNHMLLKVGHGGPVCFVLKMSNTLCLTLAFLGSAGKKMGNAAILYLDGNIWSKK